MIYCLTGKILKKSIDSVVISCGGVGYLAQIPATTGEALPAIGQEGTLYTILAKFQEERLIDETAVEGRRRTYRITERGRALYRAELDRLRLCVADGEREGQLALYGTTQDALPGREEGPKNGGV